MIRGALLAAVLAGSAAAHDGEAHGAADGAGPGPAAPAGPAPFPVALGGPFALTDQHGAPRGAGDPAGRMQLLFFGYANCTSICPVALPAVAEAVDRLAARGVAAVPVMITVDPARDTVATIGAPLARWHPDFVGLTGSEAALAQVRTDFSVEVARVTHTPEGAPVYAHGGFVYILDPEGRVLTLLPPILSPDRLADIVAGYADR